MGGLSSELNETSCGDNWTGDLCSLNFETLAVAPYHSE